MHLVQIAKILDNLNADIIVLSEIEDFRVLEELRHHMKRRKKYESYLITGGDTINYMNVAILTKITPDSISRISSFGLVEYFKKKCRVSYNSGVAKNIIAYFTIKHPPLPKSKKEFTKIALLGAHLISRPTDPATIPKREVQASLIRDFVESSQRKDYKVIVAGNSFYIYIENLPVHF
jgi:hypothetical protein